MNRLFLIAAFGLVVAEPAFAQPADAAKLQGIWEVTAMVDDGVLVPDDIVRSQYAVNGRFTIDGQSISFLTPGTLQKRTVLYVINDKTNPKTIDLAGASKTDGKGIYLLSEDVLMLCVGEPEAKQRPTEFAANKGSPYLLATLKRVKANAPSPAVTQPVAVPPAQSPVVVPPAQLKDDDIRKALYGTWGHQDEDWVTLFTVNTDGTFSSRRTFKKKFGKLFHEDVRSSGNWKLQDGVVICNITASTEGDMRNQIFSYRIRSISGTELFAVDQFGRLRREWKTR